MRSGRQSQSSFYWGSYLQKGDIQSYFLGGASLKSNWSCLQRLIETKRNGESRLNAGLKENH